MNQENYIKGMLMIMVSAFSFACMNICVRMAGDIPSIEKSFFRNLVAAIVAGSVLWKNHISIAVEKPNRLPLALRCAFGCSGILCHFYAIDHLLVADASILNKLSPFFAILFSYLILKENIRLYQGGCVVIAFLGCLFVVKPGFNQAGMFPAVIGVCGGLSAGIAYTMVRKMAGNGVKGPLIVWYFSMFSCIFVVPFIAINYVPITWNQFLILIGAGIFAAGGQFAITAAYTYAPAAKISIYDYSQIIFATILGYCFFGEIPDQYSFAGYSMIIGASLGMFLFNRRDFK